MIVDATRLRLAVIMIEAPLSVPAVPRTDACAMPEARREPCRKLRSHGLSYRHAITAYNIIKYISYILPILDAL